VNATIYDARADRDSTDVLPEVADTLIQMGIVRDVGTHRVLVLADGHTWADVAAAEAPQTATLESMLMDIGRMENDHYKIAGPRRNHPVRGFTTDYQCAADGAAWPCDTAMLLTALRVLRGEPR
jgi:hypothetical protein